MEFKAYIHDKQIIFANLVLILVAIYTSLLVVLRVDSTQSVAIVRNNTTLGLAGFEKGDTTALYQFAIIGIVIAVAHTLLAMRFRSKERIYAVITLALGIVVEVLLMVITSSILSLYR